MRDAEAEVGRAIKIRLAPLGAGKPQLPVFRAQRLGSTKPHGNRRKQCIFAVACKSQRGDLRAPCGGDARKQRVRCLRHAAACRQIGEYGLSLLEPGAGILTHCNAGHLATSEYGTALAPLYLGQERGYGFRVYADETRPLLQGARLTSYELMRAGIDVTLICDNMASLVMSEGRVQAVLVGCDRIAANGDAANKIGTSGVAVLARHYGIPFYVLGPT